MRFNILCLQLIVLFIISCQPKANNTPDKELTSADSLKLTSLLNTLDQNYTENNDSMILLCNKVLLQFSAKAEYINIKIAHLHFAQGNYVLAEHFFNQSAQIYLKDSLFEKYAEQLTNIGVMKEVSGSYTEAIEMYLKALKIFDKEKKELKSSMIYNNIGIVYQQLEEFEKSLAYYRKSLAITKKMQRDDISARRYNNIASVFEEMDEQIDSSMFYYQKSSAIWNKTDNKYLAIVENNIGAIHLQKNELLKADSLFTKAMKYCVASNNNNIISQILRNQAQLLIAKKEYSKAISKAKKAISRAQNSSNKEIELESLEVLIEALEKTSTFAKANKRLKEYYQLKDELSGIEQKKQVNKLNIQFKTQEKVQKIQILELEQSLMQKRVWLLRFLTLALIIFSSGSFWVFRLQRKNNELKMIQMRHDISDYIIQLEEIKEKQLQKEEDSVLNKLKKFGLTETEEKVLLYISKGFKNQEIAGKMFVSINTIKTHIKNIFSKLNVRNRIEAAKKAQIM